MSLAQTPACGIRWIEPGSQARIVASPTLVNFSTVAGTGAIDLTNAVTSVSGTTTAGSTFVFEDGNGVLELNAGNTVNNGGTTVEPFASVIRGFRAGDTIDLGTAGVSGVDVLRVTYPAGAAGLPGTLRFVMDVNDVPAPDYLLNIAGIYQQSNFTLTAVASGGNTDYLLTTSAACYRAGTLIRAERGETANEQIRAGDRVATVFGGLTDVVWLGYRRVDCRHHPRPEDVWPVRVCAGAFGENLPKRDLWLSPDHAVYIDGVLIPIRYLINNATIAQERVDEVMYRHVELAAHDAVYAEGLPAESYLDTGNRGAFANAEGPVQMHPDFALQVWAAESCAPLVREGAELIAPRSALLERAEALGHATTGDAAVHVVVEGRRIGPILEGPVHLFAVAGAAAARMSADSDDHRRLGVAISRITLNGDTLALTDARLGDGWHAVECDDRGRAWRWTNGEAVLSVGGGVLRSRSP